MFYGSALYFSGDIDEAQGALRAGGVAGREVGNRRRGIYALGYLAMISAESGQLAEAEDLVRCATGSRRDLADGEHFVDAMVSLAAATVLDMRGDAAAAADAARLAVGLARKGAGILEVANALPLSAKILAHLGDHETAAASRNEAGALLRGRADAAIAQTCSPQPARHGRRGERVQPGVRSPVRNAWPRSSRSLADGHPVIAPRDRPAALRLAEHDKDPPTRPLPQARRGRQQRCGHPRPRAWPALTHPATPALIPADPTSARERTIPP